MEDEIRSYGGGTSRQVNNSIVEEELVDLFAVPLTYENDEFLEEVDEIFRSTSKRNVVDIVERVTEDRNTVVGENNGKRKRDWLARSGVSGSDITRSCSEKYDFEQMRNLIDTEYPRNWDPENPLNDVVSDIGDSNGALPVMEDNIVFVNLVVEDSTKDNNVFGNVMGEDSRVPENVDVQQEEVVVQRESSTIGIVAGFENLRNRFTPIGFSLGLGESQATANGVEEGSSE
ncbi:unnamed protein product [Arabis nemorensis]|uniref:Uncharacterized protein n=1 Tax=Arabis nemorensis TaxID=586526 RepID=A0A565AS71_9BRAS|nr:unnamed protein product [Arabis nemorensis]